MGSVTIKALASALAVALLLALWQWREASLARAGKADVQHQFDVFKQAATQQALQQSEAHARETARRIKTQSEVIDAQVLKTQAAQAAAARAAAVAGSVRSETDRLAARGRAAAADPALGPEGQAAGAAAAVLAELLGRCSDRRRELAGYADQARIAGEACVGAYEALTPDTTTDVSTQP